MRMNDYFIMKKIRDYISRNCDPAMEPEALENAMIEFKKWGFVNKHKIDSIIRTLKMRSEIGTVLHKVRDKENK